MNDLIDYINANRARYTREAISEQLLAAGHDREAVAKAWEASDEALRAAAESAPARPRFGWLTLGLIVVGEIAIFLVGAQSPYVIFVAIGYLIGAPIYIGVGIGLVRLVDGGHWKAAVGLIIGLLVFMLVSVVGMVSGGALFLQSIAPQLTLLVAALVALFLVGTRMGAPREVNAVAYAFPVVAWLAATGTCVATAGAM